MEKFRKIDEQITSHPAKVYDLMLLMNLLSKAEYKDFNAQLLSEQIAFCAERITGSNKPIVVHRGKAHIEVTQRYLSKLQDQFTRANQNLDLESKTAVTSCLGKVDDYLERLDTANTKVEFLIDPPDIFRAFEIESITQSVLDFGELDFKTSFETLSTKVDSKLTAIKITPEIVKNLIVSTAKNVLSYEFKNPIDFTSVVKTPSLLWGIKHGAITYRFSEEVDLGTFLKYEIPHNIAHLIHLDKLGELKSDTYLDGMAERAFFEGVAIYSEKLFSGMVDTSPLVGNISSITQLNCTDIADWFKSKRLEENALRAVRLLGDYHTLEGASFEDMKNAIYAKLPHIPKDLIDAEVSIYYQWTGLGSIYTAGGYKLLSLNQDHKTIFDSLNEQNSTWSTFKK